MIRASWTHQTEVEEVYSVVGVLQWVCIIIKSFILWKFMFLWYFALLGLCSMRNSLTGTTAVMSSEIKTLGSKGDRKNPWGLTDWKTKISAGVKS